MPDGGGETQSADSIDTVHEDNEELVKKHIIKLAVTSHMCLLMSLLFNVMLFPATVNISTSPWSTPPGHMQDSQRWH